MVDRILGLESHLYTFKAKVLRAVDGDTLVIFIDRGFDDWSKKTLRFARIDAPEKRGESRVAGLAATQFVEEALVDHGLVAGKTIEEVLTGAEYIILKTVKNADSFGRYLAEVFIDGINLGDMMLEAGHAVMYERGR